MKTLTPLTEDEIKEKDYLPEQLWHVKWQGEVMGPFETTHLKSFLEEHPEFTQDLFVKRLSEDRWVGFWEQPLLLRRPQPKMNSVHELHQHERFFLIKEGQRLGPFNESFIREWIKEKKCEPHDLVSQDEGLSWTKLFQHETFGKDYQIQSELPSTVEEIAAHGEVIKPQETHDIQNEMASLVLGPKDSEKQLIIEDVTLPDPPSFHFPWKPALLVSCLTTLFVLTLWWVVNPNSSTDKTVVEDDSAPVSFKKYRPTPSRKPASIAPRLPAPSIGRKTPLPERQPASSPRRRNIPEMREVHEREQHEPAEVVDFPEVEPAEEAEQPNLVRQPEPRPTEDPLLEREPAAQPVSEDDHSSETPVENQVEESGDF
jgi:hypothetical protein